MTGDERDPAAYAADIEAARDRLIAFAAISALIAGLSADQLAAGDDRVRLFAQIAIRHADNHRADMEAALAAQGIRHD